MIPWLDSRPTELTARLSSLNHQFQLLRCLVDFCGRIVKPLDGPIELSPVIFEHIAPKGSGLTESALLQYNAIARLGIRAHFGRIRAEASNDSAREGKD